MRQADEAESPYPSMFEAALGDSYDYEVFDVPAGELPPASANVDGYLITGSPAGVHDEEPWLGRLRHWLRALPPDVPLVGICFGHQVMADAFGGAVATVAKGVGVGLHAYEVSSREPWMDDVRQFVLPAYHRDQVITVPPRARVVAASAFCPIAALTYTDREAISFQGHPEITPEFLRNAIAQREREGKLSPTIAASARGTLQNADDRSRVITWIRRFVDVRTAVEPQ